MAFTAEDGTGLPAANSLSDVAFADAYFADRGIAAWVGDGNSPDLIKQTALVRATDYIETRFGTRFKGDRAVEGQALSFPRTLDDVVGTTVPDGVRKAAAEYALRALTTTLAPDPVYDETGRQYASKSEKVGPISESVAYSNTGPGSSPVLFKPYPAADALLRPYLKSAPGLIRT